MAGYDPFEPIDYSPQVGDQAQSQKIAQYYQTSVPPSELTRTQQNDLLRGMYDYSTNNSNTRMYIERQRELNRQANTGAVGYAAVDMGSWVGVDAVLKTVLPKLGMKYGFFKSMTLPTLATMPVTHFIESQLDYELERQKRINSMALDFNQYSNQMSVTGLLGRGQQNFLATNLMTSMDARYQFFKPDEQLRIMKLGLSSGLLDSRSKPGFTNEGDLKQFQRNFEELRKQTEEVVKLLNTTIEGGMSFIKNYKDMGFKANEIKRQIQMTKGFGELSGLGVQNMGQLAMAGAQNVQGTMYSSTLGASLYQANAASATLMARGSSTGQYAVERVGGAAQAGAILSNIQMSLMSSGIGRKFFASAMNPDGTIDETRMQNLLTGKPSAFGIASGANQTGFNMGLNRILFPLFMEDAINNMAKRPDGTIERFTQQEFDVWRSRLPGNVQQQAYAFAKRQGLGPRETALFYTNLLSNKGLGARQGAMDVADWESTNYTPARYYGSTEIEARKAWHGAEMLGRGAAYGIINESYDIWDTTRRVFGKTGAVIGGAYNQLLLNAGIGSPYRDVDYTYRRNEGLGNITEGLKIAYGLESARGSDWGKGLDLLAQGKKIQDINTEARSESVV